MRRFTFDDVCTLFPKRIRKIIRTFNSPCWEWTGTIGASGYGRIMYSRKVIQAHRLSWIVHNGKIPKGLWVLHKCNNRCCCNPNHLYVGTPKDNYLDMIVAGRDGRPKGQEHGMAKLTNKDVLFIRANFVPRKPGNRFFADKYGVHPSLINLIVHRKIWKNV
jgi:hypothetical protein